MPGAGPAAGRAPLPAAVPLMQPVLVAGAGPVGLVAAAALVRRGIPVTVLEAEPALPIELRASTFHAPTLDMLDALGAARPMIAQGLVAPRLQYRNRDHSLIAEFDFGRIADLTRHPFRVQVEQFQADPHPGRPAGRRARLHPALRRPCGGLHRSRRGRPRGAGEWRAA
ncbi:NAD(P)/FAD-dependent oxidoreductase [Siccirubricoccus sp. G192]|uniref:FAD-dependent oxidoreductase n=1 Tax=Siccirubricoccus sp. G192 TaxID=2849651 RepID=UPI001C2BC5C4|nr:FAD-dependent monooxygenase [Siccirubricoccus sp. G192]MBV1798249.1 FAD-dependent monooxygenase [Siccirubricoccus sp. G192]